jgi:hypothetical protein
MICRINILYLKTNKGLRLSDKATQFWVNKSDIVRLISKLGTIQTFYNESNNIQSFGFVDR